MKHLTGYVVLAAAAGALCAAPRAANAVDQAAAPQVVRADAASAPSSRDALGRVSNLDPARGPVGSDPHALPADAVDWKSDAPHHTWRGTAAN